MRFHNSNKIQLFFLAFKYEWQILFNEIPWTIFKTFLFLSLFDHKIPEMVFVSCFEPTQWFLGTIYQYFPK